MLSSAGELKPTLQSSPPTNDTPDTKPRYWLYGHEPAIDEDEDAYIQRMQDEGLMDENREWTYRAIFEACK